MTGVDQVRIAALGCAMPAETSSVPLLRRFACGLVRHWGLPDSVEEAVEVIVTELAANAVRHSGSKEVVVRLSCSGGRLVLHVEDFGRWRPPPATDPAQVACSGRGLDLVNAFAAACAVVPTAAGTRVTAELLLPEPVKPEYLITSRSNGSV